MIVTGKTLAIPPLGWDHLHADSDPELLEASCRDPETPAETLLYLSRLFNLPSGLSKTIAANPSLPLSGLIGLIQAHPDIVSQNPAFRMHIAMDPSVLNSLDIQDQKALVRNKHTDPHIIRYLAGPRSRPIPVRAAAARNPECPPEIMVDYLRHAWRVRLALTMNPALPSDVQKQLARDKKLEVRWYLAMATATQADTLRMLGQPDESEQVLRAVVRNKNTPDDVILQLHREGPKTIQRSIELMCQYGQRSLPTAILSATPSGSVQ